MKFSIGIMSLTLVNMTMASYFFDPNYSGQESIYSADSMYRNNQYASNKTGCESIPMADLIKSVSNCTILSNQLSRINKILEAGYIKETLVTNPEIPILGVATYVNTSRELYLLFKSCLYLVDHTRFTEYSHSLTRNDFVCCYFIIVSSLDCLSSADKYIQLLVECETGSVNEKVYDSIFLYDKNIFTEFTLKCKTIRKLPPCDLLLSCKKILCLDLCQRTRILEYIFRLHLSKMNDVGRGYQKFINLYTEVYIRGTPEDIRLTSLVLHILYSDVFVCKFTPEKYKQLFKILEEHLSKPTERTKMFINFLCVLTIGTC